VESSGRQQLLNMSANLLNLQRFPLAWATVPGVMLLPGANEWTETETRMSVALRLQGYRLTTAEILYRLPDHPGILQSYVWQEFDLAPRYPALHKFLDFWRRELEGEVHSVRVASARLSKVPAYRNPGAISTCTECIGGIGSPRVRL
jgi:uncharacterized protein Usg